MEITSEVKSHAESNREPELTANLKRLSDVVTRLQSLESEVRDLRKFKNQETHGWVPILSMIVGILLIPTVVGTFLGFLLSLLVDILKGRP